jgi:hypothetical protein
VGLTEAQTEAVLHLHEVLADPANWGGTVYAGRTAIAIPEAGLSTEILQRRVDQYSERLENYRAGMIARTETLTASNEGQRQLWVQAEKEGLLTEQEQREWIWHGMPDKNGKLCEICAAMQGQLRGIKEPFTLPDGTQVMNPPAHPQCECTQGISERTLADRKRVESRTAGGPGSGWFRDKGHVPHGKKEGGGTVQDTAQWTVKERKEFCRSNDITRKVDTDSAVGQAVMAYKDDESYAFINESLRIGDIEGLEGDVQDLDRAFDRHGTVLKQDMVLYRGVHDMEVKEGTVLHDKGYTSTALNPNEAVFFAQGSAFERAQGSEVFRVLVPKGSRVLVYGGEEQEVTLPRNGRYRIGRGKGSIEGVPVREVTYLGTRK